MRQGSNNGRRPRGRTNRKQHGGGGGGGGQPRIHTFDSNGPDGRVRGNARQVYEKYLSLARDATSAGDRIAAEAYYQFAEHYFRILSDSTDPTPSGRRPDDRQPQPFGHDDGYDGGDDDDDAAVNGHAAAHQRQYDQRGNDQRGNGQPGPRPYRDQQPREHGPREPREPRESGPRQSGPRQSGPREAAPRQSQPPAPLEPAPAPAAMPAPAQAPVQGQAEAGAVGEGDAQRPRRGRPRKPRTNDDGQAVPQDGSPETESGPVG